MKNITGELYYILSLDHDNEEIDTYGKIEQLLSSYPEETLSGLVEILSDKDIPFFEDMCLNTHRLFLALPSELDELFFSKYYQIVIEKMIDLFISDRFSDEHTEKYNIEGRWFIGLDIVQHLFVYMWDPGYQKYFKDKEIRESIYRKLLDAIVTLLKKPEDLQRDAAMHTLGHLSDYGERQKRDVLNIVDEMIQYYEEKEQKDIVHYFIREKKQILEEDHYF